MLRRCSVAGTLQQDWLVYLGWRVFLNQYSFCFELYETAEIFLHYRLVRKASNP